MGILHDAANPATIESCAGWLACAVILPGSALSAGGKAVNE